MLLHCDTVAEDEVFGCCPVPHRAPKTLAVFWVMGQWNAPHTETLNLLEFLGDRNIFHSKKAILTGPRRGSDGVWHQTTSNESIANAPIRCPLTYAIEPLGLALWSCGQDSPFARLLQVQSLVREITRISHTVQPWKQNKTLERGKFKPVFSNKLMNDLVPLALLNKIPQLGVPMKPQASWLCVDRTKYVQNKDTSR